MMFLNRGRFFLFSLVLLLILACQEGLPRLLPKQLNKGVELQHTKAQEKATAILSQNNPVKLALDQFKPKQIHVGVYPYQGIHIYLSISEFENSNEAFGFLTSLVNEPRIIENALSTEYRYKHPFAAGRKKNTVTLIFSSPANYFAFYPKILKKIMGDINIPHKTKPVSYHADILPKENRYSNSKFFLKAATKETLPIENAFAAKYQVKQNIAYIYVSHTGSDSFTQSKFKSYKSTLKKNKISTTLLPHMAGGPGGGVYWQTDTGIHVVYPYRWLLLILTNFPDVNQAELQIRQMFMNMQKLRHRLK